ncbi:MAG: hypothetical protein AMJ79_11920 [Phycisphaerae bacterium SM23_30]|nr:MAG: hypothetical protein AMJ79_11920 [Phycisphaerae bacterium SM23_30]
MDWNSDGKKDLLVGDTDGYIYIYLNTATDAAPVLVQARLLQLNGDTFNLGERAKPEITDFNNDGKKDLIVGLDNGDIFLLINTGTDAAPVFSQAAPLSLNAGLKPQPRAFDWNNDGKKDLLCADERAVVHYFENIGTDEKPAFAQGKTVQTNGVDVASFYRTRLDITDFNNDGQPDLLYGATSRDDHQGYLYLYLAQKQ